MNINTVNCFNAVPDHLLQDNILPYFEVKTLVSVMALSHKWQKVVTEANSLWHYLFKRVCSSTRVWAMNALPRDASWKDRYIFVRQKETPFLKKDNQFIAKKLSSHSSFAGILQEQYIALKADDRNTKIYSVKNLDTLINLWDRKSSAEPLCLEMPKEIHPSSISDFLGSRQTKHKIFCSLLIATGTIWPNRSIAHFKKEELWTFIWNVENGHLYGQHRGKAFELSTEEALQDRVLLLHEGQIRYIDLKTNPIDSAHAFLPQNTPSVLNAISYKDSLLALHNDGYLRLWNRCNGQLVKNLRKLDSCNYTLLDNLDTPVLTVQLKESFQSEMIDLFSGRTLATFTSQNIFFSTEGFLAFNSSKHTLTILDRKNLRKDGLKTSKVHKFQCMDLFGENIIITASKDTKIRIWDRTTLKKIYSFEAPSYAEYIHGLRMIQDKLFLTTTGWDDDEHPNYEMTICEAESKE